jgi:hypothetical protein
MVASEEWRNFSNNSLIIFLHKHDGIYYYTIDIILSKVKGIISLLVVPYEALNEMYNSRYLMY